MSKEIYMSHLKLKLKTLPHDEVVNAMNYCEEYFEEAGVGNEDQVIKELGSPEVFAAQIKADYTVRNLNQPEKKNTKDNMKNIWLILLGILALTFSSPVVIVLAVMIFVSAILFLVFSFVFFILLAVFAIVSVSLLWKGLGLLFTSTPQGIITIGTALITFALAILIGLALYGLFLRFLPLCAKGLSQLFNKMKGGRNDDFK